MKITYRDLHGFLIVKKEILPPVEFCFSSWYDGHKICAIFRDRHDEYKIPAENIGEITD